MHTNRLIPQAPKGSLVIRSLISVSPGLGEASASVGGCSSVIRTFRAFFSASMLRITRGKASSASTTSARSRASPSRSPSRSRTQDSTSASSRSTATSPRCRPAPTSPPRSAPSPPSRRNCSSPPPHVCTCRQKHLWRARTAAGPEACAHRDRVARSLWGDSLMWLDMGTSCCCAQRMS